jgi:hypothetical protein
MIGWESAGELIAVPGTASRRTFVNGVAPPATRNRV